MHPGRYEVKVAHRVGDSMSIDINAYSGTRIYVEFTTSIDRFSVIPLGTIVAVTTAFDYRLVEVTSQYADSQLLSLHDSDLDRFCTQTKSFSSLNE